MPDVKDGGEEYNTYSSLSCSNVFIGAHFSGLLFITRLAKPKPLGFYRKYAYFYKKKVVSNPHLAVFVSSKKKFAAVRALLHLSLKLKALLERTAQKQP